MQYKRVTIMRATTVAYFKFPVRHMPAEIHKCFSHDSTAPSGPHPPHCRGFTITTRHTSLDRLLCTSDQPIAQTNTWQHTTLTRDRYACPRRESNPQSQQTSGLRQCCLWDRRNP